MRYPIIDGLRGFFLLNMMIVHLTFGDDIYYLPWINHHSLGLVEDAQGFVFLSGGVIGLVYGRMMLRATPQAMQSAIMGRIRLLFTHHLLLVLVLTALALWFFGVPLPSGLYNAFGDNPIAFGILSALLLTGGPFIDILPMYIVFMALTPLALRASMDGRWLHVIAVSVGFWVFAQFGILEFVFSEIASATGMEAAGQRLGIHFNRFAWQILYFPAMVFGVLFAQGKIDFDFLAQRNWAPVVAVAAAVAALFAVCDIMIIRGVMPQPIQSSIYALSERSRMGPFRVVNFVALLVVMSWLLTAAPRHAAPVLRWIGNGVRWIFSITPLVLLGRHSLRAYTFHVLVVYLVHSFFDPGNLTQLGREMMLVAGAASLALPVAWGELISARARQRREAAAGDERRTPRGA